MIRDADVLIVAALECETCGHVWNDAERAEAGPQGVTAAVERLGERPCPKCTEAQKDGDDDETEPTARAHAAPQGLFVDSGYLWGKRGYENANDHIAAYRARRSQQHAWLGWFFAGD